MIVEIQKFCKISTRYSVYLRQVVLHCQSQVLIALPCSAERVVNEGSNCFEFVLNDAWKVLTIDP